MHNNRRKSRLDTCYTCCRCKLHDTLCLESNINAELTQTKSRESTRKEKGPVVHLQKNSGPSILALTLDTSRGHQLKCLSQLPAAQAIQ